MRKQTSKKSTQLNLIGLIDINTDSIRMNISEINDKGKVRTVEELWVTIAIGRDIFTSGMISNNTISDIVKILNNFKELLCSYKVEKFKSIASYNIKEASNLDTVFDRIYNETDIKIELLEPIVETEILISKTKDIINNIDINALIIVIGAGSTIIILQSNGKIVFSETHNIGTLRLAKNFDIQKKNLNIYYDYLSNKFLNSLRCLPLSHQRIDKFIVINDELPQLFKHYKIKKSVDELYRFTTINYHRFCKKINQLSDTALQSLLQVQDDIVRSTIIALMIVEKISDLLKVKDVLFPDLNRTNALIEKFSQLAGESVMVISNEIRDNIISSAIELGYKYKFDYAHSMQVCRLALLIFDGMQDFYGFDTKARLYLEVASILHDIGYFVNSKSHHKHSAALIMASEILGLNHDDMTIIAQVARYHRKSPPQHEHPHFSVLPVRQRIIISSLSAIIRIADALDRAHIQIIDDLKLRIGEGECEMFVKMKHYTTEHLTMLRTVVSGKSDLFESFYGLSLTLTKM